MICTRINLIQVFHILIQCKIPLWQINKINNPMIYNRKYNIQISSRQRLIFFPKLNILDNLDWYSAFACRISFFDDGIVFFFFLTAVVVGPEPGDLTFGTSWFCKVWNLESDGKELDLDVSITNNWKPGGGADFWKTNQ